MQIRKSVCVRGGVRRAGGASDEQALQTQWFTASSDICLSLCLSGPHGRVAWRVAWRVACGERRGAGARQLCSRT